MLLFTWFYFNKKCGRTEGFLENVTIPQKLNAWLSHFSREKPVVGKVCGAICFSLQFRISKAGVGKGLPGVLASRFCHHFSFLFVECWHCLWHMQDWRHAVCLWPMLVKVLISEIGFLLRRWLNPKG